MTVTVNGVRWELLEGATLADVLARLDVAGRGVAVALDGAVVRGRRGPLPRWPTAPASRCSPQYKEADDGR